MSSFWNRLQKLYKASRHYFADRHFSVSNISSDSKELVCRPLVSVFISKWIVSVKSLLVQFESFFAPGISYFLCGFEVQNSNSCITLRRGSTGLSVSSTNDVLSHLVGVCDLSYGSVLHFVLLVEASLNSAFFLGTSGGAKCTSKYIFRLNLGHVSLVSRNAALYRSVFLFLSDCHFLDSISFRLLLYMTWSEAGVAWQRVCSACLFIHF